MLNQTLVASAFPDGEHNKYTTTVEAGSVGVLLGVLISNGFYVTTAVIAVLYVLTVSRW